MKRDKCYYCKEKAINIMVCNDWGNIPLCDKKECFEKFKEEYKGQFFIKDIEDIKKPIVLDVEKYAEEKSREEAQECFNKFDKENTSQFFIQKINGGINMKYKIIIGSEKQLTQDQADKLINFLHNEGYKEGEINIMNVCDGCGVELPKDYPTEPDKDGAVLCPNCDNGKQDAMKESI